MSQHCEVLLQFLGGFPQQDAVCWLRPFQASQEISWSLSSGSCGLTKPHPGRASGKKSRIFLKDEGSFMSGALMWLWVLFLLQVWTGVHLSPPVVLLYRIYDCSTLN